MKKILFFACLSLVTGCGTPANLETDAEVELQSEQENIVIVVGEGGTSGHLFQFAARTYQKEHGGTIFEVHDGDELIADIQAEVAAQGPLTHLEYFGHGNHVGLFLNQEPGVHGGLYAYDPDSLANFRAASIYELPRDTFAEGGSITFNGCNVAEGYPEENTLAQSFSNHFGLIVTAATGPTQFSKDPAGQSVISELKELPNDYDGDLYMRATSDTLGYVEVLPQVGGPYADVHRGQFYYEAVTELLKHGLTLETTAGFRPYQYITGAEALSFCQLYFENCELETPANEWIRNLYALSMLLDAAGIAIPRTQPWSTGYLRWADDAGILTEDFVNKKWYTRGEMAHLTWLLKKSLHI